MEYYSFNEGYKFLVQTRDLQEYFIPINYNSIYLKNDYVLVESRSCKDSKYDIGIILKFEIFNNKEDKNIKRIYDKIHNTNLINKKLNYDEYLFNLIKNLIENNCDERFSIRLHGIVFEYDENNLKIYYSQFNSSHKFEYKYIVNYLYKNIKCRIDFIKINNEQVKDLINNYQNFKNILTNNSSVEIKIN
tara:strand:- start:32 stop:601 length:570 start_codon:yes stop_codon:yes gene_type:complete